MNYQKNSIPSWKTSMTYFRRPAGLSPDEYPFCYSSIMYGYGWQIFSCIIDPPHLKTFLRSFQYSWTVLWTTSIETYVFESFLCLLNVLWTSPAIIKVDSRHFWRRSRPNYFFVLLHGFVTETVNKLAVICPRPMNNVPGFFAKFSNITCMGYTDVVLTVQVVVFWEERTQTNPRNNWFSSSALSFHILVVSVDYLNLSIKLWNTRRKVLK